MKTSRNTAEVLVKCLELHKVKYIFGVPGEENLVLLEAIRNSRIKFITTRTEQGAAFMAATFGRMTGKIGVTLSTLGPGVTNLLTGVAYAQLGGFPLLVITGQKAIKNNKQGKFQIVDIVNIMKPITKFSSTIIFSDRISNITAEAIKLAETERSGAVLLELPEDIANESCNASSIIFQKIKCPVADEKAICEAVAKIEKSKHPLVIIGRNANNKLVGKELEKFLRKTKIPFISTQMGKGAIDENSRLYIGNTALSAGDFPHLALNHADTIIIVGHDVVEKPPIILSKDNKKNVIHINFFSSIAPDVYVPTHEIIGNIATTLSFLTCKIKKGHSWDFKYFSKIQEAMKKDAKKIASLNNFPLRPEFIVSSVNQILKKNDFLALDNGMYKIWVARNFTAKSPNSVLLDNTLATMGAGLSSGIALKLLYPKRKTLVMTGDGGVMMNIGEIETAVRLKINLVILILDDSGFGMIRWKQKNMDLPSFGLSFHNPDFEMLAKSFGAIGHKIEKTEDFPRILREALLSKGVHIIICPINYDEANKILGTIKNI